MDNQNKKLLLGICGFILLITVVIGGILGFKHYLKSQTYEKSINAVINDEHHNLDNKEITQKNSKIVVYDDPDEGNSYLITITYYSKGNQKTFTDQYIVDKATNQVKYQDEILPVSNLKKLYESNHFKK